MQFHFTPTYSSWLNQVELWFAKIERDVIARGVFSSVADLAQSYADISTPTRQMPAPFDGNISTLPAASAITNSLRQATSFCRERNANALFCGRGLC